MPVVRLVAPALALVALIVTAAPAATPLAECRRGCAAAKRTCLAGAAELFRGSKAGCGAATDRKTCLRDAKSERRSFKQGCGASLAACRSCCTTEGVSAACAAPGSPADTSSICPDARGGLAAYWDWLNGVFHPLAQIPTAGGFWPPYQHPGYPLLGFRHPPDWTPETIAAEHTIGVNLLRNDRTALYRRFGTWTDPSPGVRGLRDLELGSWLDAIGRPGPVRTVCVNENQTVLAPGIFAAGSNIAVECGGFTLITTAQLTAQEGLAGAQIIFNTIIMPTAERDSLIFDVFLPIHFQQFVGQSSQDSDLDGVPDSQDNAPNDPTRS